jgi:cell division protein FtsB
MDSGLEKQLERIESTVAEIVEAVRKLHDGQTAASEINQRLKRFLERRNKR